MVVFPHSPYKGPDIILGFLKTSFYNGWNAEYPEKKGGIYRLFIVNEHTNLHHTIEVNAHKKPKWWSHLKRTREKLPLAAHAAFVALRTQMMLVWSVPGLLASGPCWSALSLSHLFKRTVHSWNFYLPNTGSYQKTKFLVVTDSKSTTSLSQRVRS